jgi:replication factor C subunit 1
VHIRGEAPQEAKSKGRNKDMSKKAVLLSGPPGIGKTSSAMIISRCVHCRRF